MIGYTQNFVILLAVNDIVIIAIHNNNMITTETITNGLELKILTHY